MIPCGILAAVRLANPLLTAKNQDPRKSCKMRNFASQIFFWRFLWLHYSLETLSLQCFHVIFRLHSPLLASKLSKIHFFLKIKMITFFLKTFVNVTVSSITSSSSKVVQSFCRDRGKICKMRNFAKYNFLNTP